MYNWAMKLKTDSFFTFSLISTSILGLIKILSIIPFNRMAADDFSFAVGFLKNSFWQGQKIWYTGLTGRYTANFLISYFGALSSHDGKMILFPLLTIMLGLISFCLIVSYLIGKKPTSWQAILASAVLLVTYYQITPNPSQSWYWLNGAATYLIPTFVSLIVFSIILRLVNRSWVYFALFFLTLISSGGNELVMVINMVLSGAAFAGFYFIQRLGKQKHSKFSFLSMEKYNILVKQLSVVFAASLLSFLIVYLSPGNEGRMSGYGSLPMKPLGSVAYSFKSGPAIVYEIVGQNLLLIVLVATSIAYFFNLFKKTTVVNSDNKELLINLFLFLLAFSLFLTVPLVMIGYLSLGRVPPDRAYVVFSFIVIILLILFSYLLASYIKTWKASYKKLFFYFALINSFIFFLYGFKIVYSLAEDVYIARNYSQAFDETFLMLKNYKTQEGQKIIEIKQLPPSGLVHFWQVTPFLENWENQAISSLFGLDAVVVAK